MGRPLRRAYDTIREVGSAIPLLSKAAKISRGTGRLK
jgi:hypothetical protein